MQSCCQGSNYLQGLGVPSPAAPPGEIEEVVLDIEGAHCGACVARIESALKTAPGVANAGFSLATHRARVHHDTGLATIDDLVAAVAKAGYRASVPRTQRTATNAPRAALRRAGVAGLVMMQVMMMAWPAYVADEGSLPWDQQHVLAIASLVLIVPVLLYSALPIWTGAWRGIRAGHLGMEVPVALGIAAAFAASLPGTFYGGPVYYESIAMFVFFLMTGRWFEAKALAATVGATEALAGMLPRRAVRIAADKREDVDPASLAQGDRVWIAAGEAAPADCRLASGFTDFNEALLTGESAPAAKRPGDAILAGSLNLVAPVEAIVERAGEEQTLSLVRRLVERAATQKPRWTQFADRIAGGFVAGILGIATLGGLCWFAVDPSRALPVVIAVLVVSCPCALSLATPVALAAAASALASDGVLVTSGRAIEALAGVTRVVFDKTGTLTTGRMRLAAIEVLGTLPGDRSLAIAAALEHAMPHPVAHALVAAGASSVVLVDALRAEPGSGVEALVDGVRHRVGSAAWCHELAGTPAPFAEDDGAPMAAMARESEWLALFRFEDTVRPESAKLMTRLRELGCEPSLVSGDRVAVVDRVAGALGIRDVTSGAKPQDKAARLEQFAARGEVAAMVGDGVNDAPGLARAPVAIALAQGAAVAQSQADFIVLNPSLLAIARAIETARRARRIIVQNLAWAAAYNALTLPLALAGVLSPWMASLGMSLSSLAVVLNALRLARETRPEAIPVRHAAAD